MGLISDALNLQGGGVVSLIGAGGKTTLMFPLAMQCEWSLHSEDIVWHFEKLLIGKALHKLMVFQQAVESDVRDVMEQLKTMVKAFKTSFQGERYLLAGFAIHEHKFFYEAI